MRDEPNFESEVVSIERQILELKGRQFIGQQSIINYRTRTSNLSDYNFTIYESAPLRQFRLTLINDRSKLALLRLMVFSRVDNSDVMASPIPYKTPTAPPIGIKWRREWPVSDGYTQWVVTVRKNLPGYDHFEAYFKFFIEGTDSGVWSITPL